MTAEPLSLFDSPVSLAARRTDPVTSVAAAASITPGRMERLILDVFARRTTRELGFTDDELAASLCAHHAPTVKSARSRLTKAGELVDSGLRRLSNRGREMIAWKRP